MTTTPAQPGLNQLHSSLATLYEVLQQSDTAPTTQAVATAAELQRQLREAMSAWNALKGSEVESVNAQLRAAGLPLLLAP
jgi:aspartate aminotransferase-like enzyme